MGATMQRGNGHGVGRRFGQSVCAEGVLAFGRMDIARHFAPLRDGRSSRSAVRCLFQNLRRPLIKTFPGCLSGNEPAPWTSGGTRSMRFPEAGFSGGMPWAAQSSR